MDLSYLNTISLTPIQINILIRILCAVTALVILVLSVFHKKYNPVYVYLQIFILCMGLWNLGYVGYLAINDPRLVALCNALIYMCNSFAGSFYFIFALLFTFPATRFHYKWVLILPCLTTLFSITFPLHGFMVSFDYTLTEGTNRIPTYFGPWYFVHLLYSYVIVAAGIVCLCRKLMRKSTPNKRTVAIILLGSFFLISWNFIFTVFVPLTDLSVALSGLSHILCITAVYIGVSCDTIEQMISCASQYREDFFPVPIFIVNTHGTVVYFNPKADELIKDSKLSAYKEFPFAQILEKYKRTELPTHLPGIETDKNTAEVFLIEDETTQTIYYVQEQVLNSKSGAQLGTVYSFNNISQINRLLASLEKYAFRDMLTGAYNRHFFERKKEIITDIIQTQITLIMCDIDNLKKVNDQYGHIAGDSYIKACCQALFISVRKQDLIFRLGGDEFLVLLPDTDNSVAQNVIERIKNNLSLPKYDGFICGMSIGCATETISQDFQFARLLERADESMYEDKKKRKAIRE